VVGLEPGHRAEAAQQGGHRCESQRVPSRPGRYLGRKASPGLAKGPRQQLLLALSPGDEDRQLDHKEHGRPGPVDRQGADGRQGQAQVHRVAHDGERAARHQPVIRHQRGAHARGGAIARSQGDTPGDRQGHADQVDDESAEEQRVARGAAWSQRERSPGRGGCAEPPGADKEQAERREHQLRTPAGRAALAHGADQSWQQRTQRGQRHQRPSRWATCSARAIRVTGQPPCRSRWRR